MLSMPKLDKLANVAIIVTCVFLCAALSKRFFVTQSSGNRPPEIKANEILNIPGYDWSASTRTLVLALRSDCHYCTDSAPFYRKLIADVSKSNTVRVLAVLPGSEDNSRHYLTGLGIPIPEVRTIPLGSLKVAGTPTLLLVNRDGVVQQVWRGKLAPKGEEEVLQSVTRPT